MNGTLSLAEAAEYLGLGRDSTKALFDSGELPGVSLNQKHLRFRLASVDAYLLAQEVKQTAARKRAAEAMSERAQDPAPARSRGRRILPDLAPYERAAGITTGA